MEDYVKHQAWGTPQELLDKLWARRDIIGNYEWNSITSYGGMPFADAEKSMELIGKKVLPEIKELVNDLFFKITWQAHLSKQFKCAVAAPVILPVTICPDRNS